MGCCRSHEAKYRFIFIVMSLHTPAFLCRLCRRPQDHNSVIPVGPFPQAAQYYPDPEEFADDCGVMLNLIECTSCGLTQLTNEPVDYFRQVITAASLSQTVRKQRLELFSAMRLAFPLGTALNGLEIGCAGGDNLPLLQEAGFEPLGIEYNPSKPSGEICPQGILNHYLLDLDSSHHESYDLVVSFNYLEHQPDPHAFLSKCHALLKPNGRLLLTVPNLDFLLESHSGHEFVTDHLVYFTSDTLETALRLSGFQLLAIEIINNRYDIQIVACKRQESPILASKIALVELVMQLNSRLREFAEAGKKVAVWGAGHRTLALLSLAEHQLIHCIIDSAKFKHYKYAPLSHLQIMPPETLLNPSCGIDTILVMVPGIYPKEVIQNIQSLPVRYHAEQFPP